MNCTTPAAGLLVLISACSLNDDKKVKGSFAGVARSEFSVAWDTITLEPLNTNGRIYRIIHRTGYQRIKDGRFEKKHHRIDTAIAIFHEGERRWEEQKRGRVYLLSHLGQGLLMGASSYQRIE